MADRFDVHIRRGINNSISDGTSGYATYEVWQGDIFLNAFFGGSAIPLAIQFCKKYKQDTSFASFKKNELSDWLVE